MDKKKIKVLVVDDSELARDIIGKGLSRDQAISVIGTADNAFSARDFITHSEPDVLTLDIKMPKMDGLEFLKRLMPQYPIPVVVVSALTEEGSLITLEALKSGAIDFVLKPSAISGITREEMIAELIKKVKMAASTDVSHWKRKFYTPPRRKAIPKISDRTTNKIIGIGASTGGVSAITQIVKDFPSNIPGTIIVQHMPKQFTYLFARDLNKQVALEVKEAETGDILRKGQVLIAPGGVQCKIIRKGKDYVVDCAGEAKVNGHRPSVEVLFNSLAEAAGPQAMGVLLTGMGADGAYALLNMRRAGARTLAQDEATSVVYSMPKVAYECGGAEQTVALDKMAFLITRLLREMR